jgi:NTP pyrophosphatase (non-canonical NTP hydrolase)
MFLNDDYSLRNLQTQVANLYTEREYTTDLFTLMLGLCEETGEVAKAINVIYNPCYKPSEHSVSDTLEHELCDLMVYLLAIANAAGVDMQLAMHGKLQD